MGEAWRSRSTPLRTPRGCGKLASVRMDPYLAKIDARFDRFERYFDARLDEMERRVELRLAEFEHRITIRAGAIMLAGMSIAAAVVKLL